jgi:hypothetical protein
MSRPDLTLCRACGAKLEPALALAGSLRCHDCRDLQRPLQAEFVRRSRASAPEMEAADER